MKGKVIALVFVVAVATGGWWAVQTITSDDSFSVQIAFGVPHEGTIELHAVVSMGMTAREGPRIAPNGKLNWAEWVEEHFDLRTVSGQRLPLALRSSCDVIKPAQVTGTPEGYLFAKVEQGGDYQFDYKPKRAEAKRYRHVFTAPTGDVKVSRKRMEPA